jgi:AMP-polyphosphate phosphotransferase
MEETTKSAPWYLIPSNSKPYSRIAALTILADRFGKHVPLAPRPIDPGILKEARKALRLTPADIRQALEPRQTKIRTPA